jgi:hypothetical protein
VRVVVALVVVVAALIGLGALFGGANAIGQALFEKTDRRAEALDPEVRRVEVDVSGGEVVLRGTDDPPRLVQRREWVLGGPEVEHRVEDGTLHVDAGCDGWTFGGCHLALDLAVPEGVPVRARLRAGGLRLAGTLGALRLDVAAGGIDLDDVTTRRLVAEVSAGGLRGRLLRAPRLLDVRTTAGGVDLDVPRGRYAVDASATAGGVDVSGLVRDDRAPRRIRVRTTAGGTSITGR